jgi:hypothetical protein
MGLGCDRVRHPGHRSTVGPAVRVRACRERLRVRADQWDRALFRLPPGSLTPESPSSQPESEV